MHVGVAGQAGEDILRGPGQSPAFTGNLYEARDATGIGDFAEADRLEGEVVEDAGGVALHRRFAQFVADALQAQVVGDLFVARLEIITRIERSGRWGDERMHLVVVGRESRISRIGIPGGEEGGQDAFRRSAVAGDGGEVDFGFAGKSGATCQDQEQDERREGASDARHGAWPVPGGAVLPEA